MRTPLSAVGSFLSKALANPSVTRVETNPVPAASRFLKVMVAGRGEPVQRMPVSARVANSPCDGTPTLNGLLTGLRLMRIVLGAPLIANVANTACREPAPSWLALPRILVSRNDTAPEAGRVNDSPLKLKELAVCSRPGT